ncbi:centriolar protein POC1 [Marchantia polymorpha subsp. ruderalis]|uniref:Uncharacterized protein n=4 Tax=Marchantia polymorpha TaxID=3197 RepID=A0AAF6BB97_MARPO|nr:hypothetical protein MARPO_0041s0127 [Marchantia polymorpha]BBN09281.1 hypothetical protein Mp_4g18460 [Marchantia polymorpha subsp. ruderalis]|eukprot:PTQ40271.1 hypothetical protein MARPO_0041s0127 [Marchantia polymorpha]
MGKQGKVSNHHPTIVSQYGSHRGGVHAVHFRPQMKHLVSGGNDNAVYLWSLHCRPNLRHPVVRPFRFLGHNGPVYSVAVSPCDDLVASGSQDKSIRLWIPTVEGKCSVIKGHTGPVRTVNFSHDGHFLLSGSDDKTIKIWKVKNQKFVCALSGHMNWVRSAEFNADRRLILSGSDDKSVRLWDVERRECVQQFSDVLGLVNSARFHPDNCCVASGNSDHCIQMWDVRSKHLIQHYAANAGAVNSVCFHPSGNYLLSSCDDATLKIWDLREGQIVFTLQGHDGATNSAEFSSSGEYFASGSADEHVLLWRTNIDLTGRQPERGFVDKEIVGHALCSACNCVCTSPPNGGGIHCPYSLNSSPSAFCRESSSPCKLPSSPTPLDNAVVSSSRESEIGCPNQTEDEKVRVKVHQPESKPEMMNGYHSTSAEVNGSDLDVHQRHASSNLISKSSIKVDVNRRSCLKAGSTILPSRRKRPCGTPRARSPAVLPHSASDRKAVGSTLKQICHQLSVLTKTVALFEERLSHSEDKMIRFEKISGDATPNEDAEGLCDLYS